MLLIKIGRPYDQPIKGFIPVLFLTLFLNDFFNQFRMIDTMTILQ